MPWQVGIDEAGYGPNLGPLVMAVVACRVPTREVDLWDGMKAVVRRHGEQDSRLLVADSKLVYTPATGLCLLESSVLAFLCGADLLVRRNSCPALLHLVATVCSASLEEMQREPWFNGATELPVAVDGDTLECGVDAWRNATKAVGLHWGLAAGVLVAAHRFNGIVDKWGSKGAVLGLGLVDLLGHCLRLPDDDAVEITVDKHGGRNFYAAMLQDAFGDGMVVARTEGADLSIYEVLGLQRTITVTFKPRADAEAFCVALASMVCKYLRELLMGEFNRFWRDKVPGLAPTAGYPGDAKRFYDDIRPALKKMGIVRKHVWRAR